MMKFYQLISAPTDARICKADKATVDVKYHFKVEDIRRKGCKYVSEETREIKGTKM